jgi:hypothetical protein
MKKNIKKIWVGEDKMNHHEIKEEKKYIEYLVEKYLVG